MVGDMGIFDGVRGNFFKVHDSAWHLSNHKDLLPLIISYRSSLPIDSLKSIFCIYLQ